MQTINPNLIADIGGTNARFALIGASGGAPVEARTLTCADYHSLDEAIRAYLKEVECPAPGHAAISIATPVTSDRLVMTNHVWNFSVKETREALGFQSLKVINDYTALALALPYLSADEYRQVGAGEALAGEVMAAIGPGTGLGVSGVIANGSSWLPLQSEGGHVSYGPQNAREAEVMAIIRRKYNHVSAETLVSGPGLCLLYNTLAELNGIPPEAVKPKQITDMVLHENSENAEQTVSMFCEILGTVAGNLALTLGARGGIYIGGGIIPVLGEYFDLSGFRQRFEQRGRLTKYLCAIPTSVIHAKYPALHGAAVSLGPDYRHLGVTSVAT